METQSSDALTARALGAHDAPEMRRLFQQVFKKDMSAELWDWKYGRSLSRSFGVFRGDEMVAHYGGVGLDISLKGTLVQGVQIADVMVNPGVRQAVRHRSPFYLATSGFIDTFVGIGQHFLFGYGFPNDRHMDLAARLKFYEPVGRMWELNWELGAAPRESALLQTVTITRDNVAHHRATLDKLWKRMSADLQDRVVIRKDAGFIDWRYLQHPENNYELLLVKRCFIGTPIGLCVVKREAERVLLLDLIGPLHEAPRLVQVALAATWRAERRKLYTWCSEPDTKRFGVITSAHALEITTPANVWTSGPSPQELQDRWWLTPGDTDFL